MEKAFVLSLSVFLPSLCFFLSPSFSFLSHSFSLSCLSPVSPQKVVPLVTVWRLIRRVRRSLRSSTAFHPLLSSLFSTPLLSICLSVKLFSILLVLLNVLFFSAFDHLYSFFSILLSFYQFRLHRKNTRLRFFHFLFFLCPFFSICSFLPFSLNHFFMFSLFHSLLEIFSDMCSLLFSLLYPFRFVPFSIISPCFLCFTLYSTSFLSFIPFSSLSCIRAVPNCHLCHT